MEGLAHAQRQQSALLRLDLLSAWGPGRSHAALPAIPLRPMSSTLLGLIFRDKTIHSFDSFPILWSKLTFSCQFNSDFSRDHLKLDTHSVNVTSSSHLQVKATNLSPSQIPAYCSQLLEDPRELPESFGGISFIPLQWSAVYLSERVPAATTQSGNDEDSLLIAIHSVYETEWPRSFSNTLLNKVQDGQGKRQQGHPRYPSVGSNWGSVVTEPWALCKAPSHCPLEGKDTGKICLLFHLPLGWKNSESSMLVFHHYNRKLLYELIKIKS